MKAVLGRSQNAEHSPEILIGGSKSESNRLLILQALFPSLQIKNLSTSDDTVLLQQALNGSSLIKDIQHAGTAMRFLTAYYASQPGIEVLLTGSERMKERPIKTLVDALRSLGAEISYAGKSGFPPLKISGKQLSGSYVELDAGISSQFISALMLIAPSLIDGLRIKLKGEVTSKPYLEMTIALLKRCGISAEISNNEISIAAANSIAAGTISVESDWSSASYFYSLIALSDKQSLILKYFNSKSRQGDSEVAAIYSRLGVTTSFDKSGQGITLTQVPADIPDGLILDLSDTPDIAQTIAISCFGLGIGCELSGLHTLKIKETDRLIALKTELEKLGAKVEITHNSLSLSPSIELREDVTVETYRDHRMAMAFAPLAQKVNITVNDAEVVSKSFPEFWNRMSKAGLNVQIVR